MSKVNYTSITAKILHDELDKTPIEFHVVTDTSQREVRIFLFLSTSLLQVEHPSSSSSSSDVEHLFASKIFFFIAKLIILSPLYPIHFTHFLSLSLVRLSEHGSTFASYSLISRPRSLPIPPQLLSLLGPMSRLPSLF